MIRSQARFLRIHMTVPSLVAVGPGCGRQNIQRPGEGQPIARPELGTVFRIASSGVESAEETRTVLPRDRHVQEEPTCRTGSAGSPECKKKPEGPWKTPRAMSRPPASSHL